MKPVCIAVMLLVGVDAFAQSLRHAMPDAVVGPEVVVSATRDEAQAFDLPVAIDSIDGARVREGNAGVNLSETLNRVPGIVVQNRQNYAQDLQVSSRGFGARAAFGVRGVRLVADGIPATMPDGQGQTATFSLGSVGRIEVLRGPFAGLYGNASGALVQTFTEDGPPEPTVTGSVSLGSFGASRIGVKYGGTQGSLNYLVEASRFETDGYRAHSSAIRDQTNAKFTVTMGAGGRLTAITTTLDQPDTQDPLGLDRAQMQSNPRQVVDAALEQNTRKSVRHRQAGLVYEHPMDGDTLRLAVHGGTRDVSQFLATPLLQQLPAASGGGVVDLDRGFGGVSLRYSAVRKAPAGLAKLTAALEYDRMDEHRRGFINQAGTIGALKRDQDDRVSSTDAFVAGEWPFALRWTLVGGVRSSTVRIASQDRFVVPGNPDDSGAVRYRGVSTAFGLLYKLDDSLHLYANTGRGFETPTLAELAYRSGGVSGLNLALRPSRSQQYEAGLKFNSPRGQRVRLAVFDIRTRDEIVVNRSQFGRTDFKNAGRTRRQGLELAWEALLGERFEAHVAWTLLDAVYRDTFTSGNAAARVPAGNRLPGVASHTFYAELVWRHAPSGFHAGAEVRRVGRVHVDDFNSEAADAYSVGSVRAGFEQRAKRWNLREFVRVDNVTDRLHAGSVIVAANQGRYYEPAPGRNYLIGLEASLAF